MNKTEYVNLLVDAFNKCKEIIKEGKREVIVIDLPRKGSEFEVPNFQNLKGFKIYSISKDSYLHESYIHLSGANILYYIVGLYLQLQDNKGTYYKYDSIEPGKRMRERVSILKRTSFIYEDTEDGFWYYPVSLLKATSIFKFDLPPIVDMTLIKGRKQT